MDEIKGKFWDEGDVTDWISRNIPTGSWAVVSQRIKDLVFQVQLNAINSIEPEETVITWEGGISEGLPKEDDLYYLRWLVQDHLYDLINDPNSKEKDELTCQRLLEWLDKEMGK